MQVHIRAFCERATNAKAGDPIPFVAATSDVARDDMVIDAKGWKLDNYQASPVVLWSHDYAGTRPPIGRAENVRIDGDKLRADIRFDQGDPFAVDIERKYREGFLNAVSVGWDTLDFKPDDAQEPWSGGKVLSAELLDISAVNVPGDPGALMERQKRALALQAHDILKLVEPEDDPANFKESKPTGAAAKAATARTTWPEVAAQMVRLLHPFVQGPDDERRAVYDQLVKDYSFHGKTAPEFLSAQEVDALSVDDIRAHCLEGEPELLPTLFAEMGTRAGAVLSKRNLDRLDSAIAQLQELRDSAQKEADQTEEERAAEASIRELRSLFVKDQTP